MARLSNEQWQAIRNAWECDPDSPSYEVAASRAGKKFSFTPPSKSNVYARCRKESWERKGTMNGINISAQRKADSLVDSDGERTKQNEQNESSGGKQNAVSSAALVQASREESEDKRAEVTARHRNEWRQVAVLRQESLALRNSNPSLAMDKARLAKISAEITTLQQAGERKAWGLDVIIDPADIKNLSDAELDMILSGRTVAPKL